MVHGQLLVAGVAGCEMIVWCISWLDWALPACVTPRLLAGCIQLILAPYLAAEQKRESKHQECSSTEQGEGLDHLAKEEPQLMVIWAQRLSPREMTFLDMPISSHPAENLESLNKK